MHFPLIGPLLRPSCCCLPINLFNCRILVSCRRIVTNTFTCSVPWAKKWVFYDNVHYLRVIWKPSSAMVILKYLVHALWFLTFVFSWLINWKAWLFWGRPSWLRLQLASVFSYLTLYVCSSSAGFISHTLNHSLYDYRTCRLSLLPLFRLHHP